MNASEYYDLHPSLEHRGGDVWCDLPTFGMLPVDHSSGVIVTPACDLQNRKSPTLTYLPLIPLRCAFCLPPLVHEVIRILNGQLPLLHLDKFKIDVPPSALPSEAIFEELETAVVAAESAKGFGEKERKAVERTRSCAKILRFAVCKNIAANSFQVVQSAFGNSFDDLMARLIGNAARPDLHFLPDDRQRQEWSGVREHSVVLFRFPLSAPIEVFEQAQDLAVEDWSVALKRLEFLGSGISQFEKKRPVKKVTIRPRYIADMLTRYVGMHVRLGSPDFSDETVKAYVQEMKGGQQCT